MGGKNLTEEQLQERVAQIYREEQIKLIKERWETLSGSEKRFIFEFVRTFAPKKSYVLSEARWWNTIGDIVGIFDPTGVVDLINGMDYIRQGDTIYGVLSLISAVPYIGDLVGKPVIGVMKAGGETSRILRGVKSVESAVKAGKEVPIFGKLLTKMGEIGPKLMEIIEKVPGGKGLTQTIRGWVEIFTKAGKEIKAGEDILKTGGKLTSADFRAFRDYGMKPEWGWFKRFWKKGGFFGKNRQLSKLIQKTKFWLGFLDFIGVANFVGPDELVQQMGSLNVDSKMEQYMNTPEAQNNWTSEMGNIPSEETPMTPQPPSSSSESKGTDPINSIISTLLGGALKAAI